MILTYNDAPVSTPTPNVQRRVLAHGPNLMLVEFIFQKDAVGQLHAHDAHQQVGYIAAGSFELTVGTETRIVRTGDSYFADLNVSHGVRALEDNSIIVDAFTPARADFL